MKAEKEAKEGKKGKDDGADDMGLKEVKAKEDDKAVKELKAEN